jgi:thymidylate synthase
MARIDIEYHELLRNILENGTEKGDRTGTGTISIFDAKIKHNMADGLPMLTTKKVFSKGVITELLWFLSGSTSIKPLVDQGNNIWVGDSYKKYVNNGPTYKFHDELMKWYERHLTKEEFIEKIKTNDGFAKRWGELGPVYGKQWVSWKSGEHRRRYSEMTPHQQSNFDIKEIENNHFDTTYPVEFTINQIQNAIDILKNNPESRRIIVSAWNVAEIDQAVLPPCHWAFELYTEELTRKERFDILHKEAGFTKIPWDRMAYPNHEWLDSVETITGYDHNFNEYEGKTINVPRRRLSLKWHQRSVDTPLGLSFNILSYSLLLVMMAQQVNMVPHMLVGDLTNVHIYKNQLDGVNEQLSRDTSTYNAPKLILNKAEDIFSYKLEDFKIEGYESYPTIKMPLSN